MLVNILGPLEITDEGISLKLPGEKLRTIVAVLSLTPNRHVSKDELIDELWVEEPPRNAENSLQGHIARLRRRIVDATGKKFLRSVIETTNFGYRLVLPAQNVDASRFSDMVARADKVLQADPQAAMTLINEALDLWRGPALVDAGKGPVCRVAYAKLVELKLAAHERLFDAMIRLGTLGSAIAELGQFHAQYPLRERFAEQLMTALYRSGRQADALAVYNRTRQRLAYGLGIEPGPALRAKFQEVLRQSAVPL